MNVCRQCGLAGNTLTCLVKYGELPKQASFSVSTMHEGICDICLRTNVPVCEDRDCYYPNWNLLQKSAWRKAMRKSVNGGNNHAA